MGRMSLLACGSLTASTMTDDARPTHLDKPHLRRVIPHPVNNGEQQGVALQDPFMLSGQTMVVPVQVANALQHFNGEWTQTELATNLKAPPEVISNLVEKLDELGLLWGPTATELEDALRAKLDEDGVVPMLQSRMLGETAAQAAENLTKIMNEADDPELEGTLTGLLAPRIDYPAAERIYASSWHAAIGLDITRVIVLGTNQYGFGEGAIGCPWGFQSPIGPLLPDTELCEVLNDQLGDAFFADALDHVACADIEMQVPFIQHTLGSPKILGVLMPDPFEPPQDDEPSVNADAFAAALRTALKTLGGRTLIVASVDLSHIGPQFGEPRPIDEQRQFEAERVDRELLASFSKGDAAGFCAAVKWNGNANRWSGVGAMTGLLQILEPNEIELIDYQQIPADDQGSAMVAAAAAAAMT